jgi:hypothetical protein
MTRLFRIQNGYLNLTEVVSITPIENGDLQVSFKHNDDVFIDAASAEHFLKRMQFAWFSFFLFCLFEFFEDFIKLLENRVGR